MEYAGPVNVNYDSLGTHQALWVYLTFRIHLDQVILSSPNSHTCYQAPASSLVLLNSN